MSRKRLRVLTWHVHGNYLYYLSQAPHEFFIVTKPHDPPGYAGRVGTCHGATTCTRCRRSACATPHSTACCTSIRSITSTTGCGC